MLSPHAYRAAAGGVPRACVGDGDGVARVHVGHGDGVARARVGHGDGVARARVSHGDGDVVTRAAGDGVTRAAAAGAGGKASPAQATRTQMRPARSGLRRLPTLVPRKWAGTPPPTIDGHVMA